MVGRSGVACLGHGPSDGTCTLDAMEHPKAIGDRTTLAVMLALDEAGYRLLVPFGENTRYDLIIEGAAQLLRVQCKTGRFRNGAVRFAVCSTYGHHAGANKPRRSYQGEVDAFAVWCRATGGVYLIPISELPLAAEGALRVDPPRNNQRRGIRFAADYEIGRVVVRPPR
jgi:hypothetical protein